MTDFAKVHKRVIIDTDAGLDDTDAILLALTEPDVEILAMTTVQGNVTARQTFRNVIQILSFVNRLDIPVFCGCESPLVGKHENASWYHGQDGMGDVPDRCDDADVVDKMMPSKHAVTAILEIMDQYPGEIDLVCLGPLTNLAVALRMRPDIGNQLRSCSIMGGNYKVAGNITEHAEFNFYNDPFSVSVVLDSLTCPITIVPWDISVKHILTWDEYDKLKPDTTSLTRFLRQIEKNARAKVKSQGYFLADQLAMAAYLYPHLVTENMKMTGSIEFCSGERKGVFSVVKCEINDSSVTIVLDMDKQKTVSILKKAFLSFSL